MPAINGIPISPLTGVLDLRSAPENMGAGSLRMRQNLETVDQGKLRRGTGQEKFLNAANYNNEDFHDQLLTFTPNVPRQPVTMLFSAISSRRTRTLFAAKQGAVASLNEYSGNWRILGSGYGGTQKDTASTPRFKTAQQGDYVVFTNDFDKPMFYVLEAGSFDSTPMLQTLPDLDTIGLTRAALVWVWHNCVFLADVEMDGQRFANRILWSGFNTPTVFDPANIGSITGFKDLFSHERILAARATANSFIIYTTHGNWEMAVVGGDQSFGFARRYNGEDNQGAAVLKYPNTLVSLEDAHLYAAEDGLYVFSPYYGKPDRIEWLHRSTSALYDQIDAENCNAHVSHLTNNQLLVSVARKGAPKGCPDITLRANMVYRVTDIVDHGYTAFASHQSFKAPTIRDFIVQNRICTLEGLRDAGYPYVNEGLPRPLPIGLAAFDPQSFYTKTAQTITWPGGSATTEDWNQPEPDDDSLCALLDGERSDDICRKCEGPVLLVAASSQDWCLKQLGAVFSREQCSNPTGTGTTDENGYASNVGSYLLNGYDSILRFAPMYAPRKEVGQPLVTMQTLLLDFLARAAAEPGSISLRVGVSGMVSDPNLDDGRIIWFQHSSKLLMWLSHITDVQSKKAGSVPSQPLRWRVKREGRVIYVELKVPGIGADADFSGAAVEAGLKAAMRY